MRPSPTLPPPDIETLRDLGPGARLVLSCFRSAVAAWRRGSPETIDWLVASLRRSVGDGEALRAAVAVSKLVAILAGGARRSFAYHEPCCPCLSADESRLVAMVESARCGDIAETIAVAGELVWDRSVADLVDCAATLVRHLPAEDRCDPGPAPDPAVRVH